jgi:hypothetical protein
MTRSASGRQRNAAMSCSIDLVREISIIESVVLEKPTIVIVAEYKQPKPESNRRNSARLLGMPIANESSTWRNYPPASSGRPAAPARRRARSFLSVMVRRWNKRESAETLKA